MEAALAVVGEANVPLNAYTFNRNEPPHNSDGSPAQAIVHPSRTGVPEL